MTQSRPLRFAGSFFPAAPNALDEAVREGLAATPPVTSAQPKAVLSAHAGYRFSGRFTGMSLGAVPDRPAKVVVLSPSHRHAFQGIAFPSWNAFQTPLGDVPVARTDVQALAAAGLALELDAAHSNEHGIETQLPFLALRWPKVPLVPLVIGQASARDVARVIDALAAPGVLFVLSSDLSHFLSDDSARAKDAQTAGMIERGTGRDLTSAHACGARAVTGWLASRTGQTTRALRLGMGNSGDVTGDLGRVVGYGAWAFYALDDDMLAAPHRATLLRVARQGLKVRLATGNAPKMVNNSFAASLRGEAASFVTLNKKGRLRGCIGSLAAHRPLMSDVVVNAQKSALQDPRFSPVTLDELAEIDIKITVLTRAARLMVSSETEALAAITPGKDGLILTSGGRRGTFLPMVWESIPDPRNFLRALKQKAGLPPDYWADDVVIERYRAESFAET